MAEFLWTFAVQEVLKKVVKLAAEQIHAVWGLEKELLKLRKELLKGEAILRDINSRKLHHDTVRMWVEDLQYLVYQADDLLDEIVYESLRQKAQTGKISKVSNLISPSNNSFIFRLKMAKKMKNIMDLLHKHYSETGPLGLVGNESVEQEIDFISQFRETTSHLDDYKVLGRDVDVECIVKRVIDASNQHVRSILPIVGMGGLGKTTLAKLVFNHEMVKKHFDKTIWVCVSEPFVVNKILGAILQNLTGASNGLDNKQVLLQELRKEMNGKTYFLVFDDVWNENDYLWDELNTCLIKITEKSENSSILVTTRSVEVAKIMETLPSHHLSKLSDDQCWTLFKESANACEELMISSLELFRKELVDKVGGIPLIARVLGRAIKFEGKDETWVKTLESVIRTPLQEESFNPSVLKLSVDHLPSSSLKQCFAYCSNFPKNFVFEKESLIEMWMAQGFIQPQQKNSNLTIENIGDTYFSILLSRCLFQDINKDDQGRILNCKMHDLIHDIACAISSDKKLQLNRTNLMDEELWEKGSKRVGNKKLCKMVCNKVIVHKKGKMIDDKAIDFVSPRVLIISSRHIYKLPNSIGKLKHLRYLEISHIAIETLPKSIVFLYNLQTLRIKKTWIRYLPENLRELVNLRHLEFETTLKKMPPYLSQMTQLQILSSFVVGLESGRSVSELGPLKKLKGSLELYRLEKVKSGKEAMAAKLVEKNNLENLVFDWSDRRKDESYNDLEVLEGLQPNENLQTLKLYDFAGKCLPNKIFVANLRIVKLCYCKNCETLPMLGHLNNLKQLFIYGLKSVRSIGNEFYGNDTNRSTIFSKLKKFELYNMINLEQWEEISVASIFPLLEELKINRCPELLKIPDLFGSCDDNGVVHFKSLTISQCNQLTELPNGLQNCHSIDDLRVDNCSNLTLNLQNMNKLVRLNIGPMQKLSGELVDELSSVSTQLSQQLQHIVSV